MTTFFGGSNLSEKTLIQYNRNLKTLNGGKAPQNLTFLKDVEAIVKRMNDFSISTQLALYGTILAVLRDKKIYSKLHKQYLDILNNLKADIKNNPDSVKRTDRQNSVFLNWEDIIKIRDNMIFKFKDSKDFNDLLHMVVLGLYTYIPPRRNADFLEMVVLKKIHPDISGDKNYYIQSTGKMIFNIFKTSKTMGTQIIDNIPAELKTLIDRYLSVHPNIKKLNGNEPIQLLVNNEGKPLTPITLQKVFFNIFGIKGFGSTALRHSYITTKYSGLKEEMKKDAENMAHSVGTQQTVYNKLA